MAYEISEMSNLEKLINASKLTEAIHNEKGHEGKVYIALYLFTGNLKAFTSKYSARDLASTIDRDKVLDEIYDRLLQNASKYALSNEKVTDNNIINEIIKHGLYSDDIKVFMANLIRDCQNSNEIINALTGNIKEITLNEHLEGRREKLLKELEELNNLLGNKNKR